jgi:hypothetical protein
VLAIRLAEKELQIEKNVVEWKFELFDEIEKPTLIDQVQVVSLLLVEAESWSTHEKN